MELVYKNETPLFGLMLALSLLCWALLLALLPTPAVACLVALVLGWLILRSSLAAWLHGTGVLIDFHQFPDLKARVDICCGRLALPEIPPAYLLQPGGNMRALAAQLLGERVIVLNAHIVDALEDMPDAINFYIGHEIGHIKRHHARWAPLLLPAAMLPLLGAAYSRACEYTCDRHGFHACDSLAGARDGLAALVAGGKRWRQLSIESYAGQARASASFWMSFHELVSDQPWLVKRMAAMHSLAGGNVAAPERHGMAALLALFIPRFGMAGGVGGVLMLAALAGMVGTGVLPGWRASLEEQRLASAVDVGKDATAAVERYYNANGRHPDSLAQAGFALDDPGRSVVAVQLDSASGVVRVFPAEFAWRSKAIAFVPVLDNEHRLSWLCGSAQIPGRLLPPECRTR